MCTFKNEIAVFLVKIDMFSESGLESIDAKIKTLLGRQVAIVCDNADNDGDVVEREGEQIAIGIFLGRFANSVLKEVFAEEIEKGLISVSASEENAHEIIKQHYQDNRYEFLNQNIVSDAAFMERPVSVHREGDI